MTFARVCDNQGNIFYAVIKNDKIVKAEGTPFTGLKSTDEVISRDEVKFLAPVLPSKVVAIGKNYYDHIKELNSSVPATPIIFIKPSTSLLDPLGEIEYPDFTGRLDYEGELAAVIKKRLKKSACGRCQKLYPRIYLFKRRHMQGHTKFGRTVDKGKRERHLLSHRPCRDR